MKLKYLTCLLRCVLLIGMIYAAPAFAFNPPVAPNDAAGSVLSQRHNQVPHRGERTTNPIVVLASFRSKNTSPAQAQQQKLINMSSTIGTSKRISAATSYYSVRMTNRKAGIQSMNKELSEMVAVSFLASGNTPAIPAYAITSSVNPATVDVMW